MICDMIHLCRMIRWRLIKRLKSFSYYGCDEATACPTGLSVGGLAVKVSAGAAASQ
jgi:hypothetical protein